MIANRGVYRFLTHSFVSFNKHLISMAPFVDNPTLKRLIAEADPTALMRYLEEAFTAYSADTAVVPPVGSLSFDAPRGDVHIKYGYIREDAYYVIKIASSFYENPAQGLPSSDGLMLVFDQKTGVLQTVLLDEGYLTDVRTALAGAIAAKYLAPPTVTGIGIVGCGTQAALQLHYLKHVTNCRRVTVAGRSEEKLAAFKEQLEPEGFDVETTRDYRHLAQQSNLIVTTTPATSPLIFADHVLPGTHITAVGADTVGKQELDEALLERADLIVVDSVSQCQHHGEIHRAYERGLLSDRKIIELGTVITSGGIQRKEGDLTVADLTGVATQDIQIAKFALDHLPAIDH